MPKAPIRTIILEHAPEHKLDGNADFYTDASQADYQLITDAEMCPVCHDLLVWHEQVCEAAPSTAAEAPAEEQAPAVQLSSSAAFAFAIGHRVQPASSAPAAITWRGQHKERHPETGLVHRINVYCLNNGYWDCYREDELQAA